MTELVKKLVETASKQNGFLTREDVIALGGTDRVIEGHVADGTLQRLQAAVFLASSLKPTWEQRLEAATLSARGMVLAGHRAAAAHYGLWGAKQGPLEVLVERRSRVRPKGVIVHQTDTLDDVDRSVHRGIAITSVARTLVDYAAVVPAFLVEQAVESALNRGLVTETQIAERIDALSVPGRRGVRRLASVMGCRLTGGPAGSYLEVLAAHLDVTIPGLVRQFAVTFPDGERVHLDWAFPDVKYNAEFDGDEYHRGGRPSRADLLRDRTLGRLGWTVRRFPYGDVVERPAWVAAEIVAAVERLRSTAARRDK